MGWVLPVVGVVVLALVWMIAWSVFFARRRYRLIGIRNEWLGRFEGSPVEQEQKRIALVQRTDEVIRLCRGAGVPNSQVPFVQPIGYGQISVGNTNLFENWLVIVGDVPALMENALLRSIGVYHDRQRHALNPLWWIGLFFTAPQHLARWFGGSGEGVATKLATLVWAAVVGIGVILGIASSVKALMS